MTDLHRSRLIGGDVGRKPSELLPHGRISCPARVRPPGNLAGVREDPHDEDQKESRSWEFSIQHSMKLTGAKSLWGGPLCRGRTFAASISELSLHGGHRGREPAGLADTCR